MWRVRVRILHTLTFTRAQSTWSVNTHLPGAAPSKKLYQHQTAICIQNVTNNALTELRHEKKPSKGGLKEKKWGEPC